MTGPALLPGWEQLEEVIPQVTVPMRRYLEQVACVLRPGSVSGADLALRSFAAFQAAAPSPAIPLAQITRRHVEDFKPWLAARPGQNKPRLIPATIAHRLGTLRMFFVRITEWGWDAGPPWPPSTTTPPPTARPDARNSSPGSSTKSTTTKHHDQLENDHPHNADDRAVGDRGRGCCGACQRRPKLEQFPTS